jgi:gas vesicle protein
MSSSSGSSSNLVWLLIGTAVGTTIALLYAPAPGSETRKRIGRKTEEGKDALTDSGKDLLEKGRDLYDQGRRIADEAAEMFDRGRKLVQG